MPGIGAGGIGAIVSSGREDPVDGANAGLGEEDGSPGFQQAGPVGNGDDIYREFGLDLVDGVQGVCSGLPIVRKEDHPVHAGYPGLGEAHSGGRTSVEEDVNPFRDPERAPQALFISSVRNTVVAPVGLAIPVKKIVVRLAVGIMQLIAVRIKVQAPGLIVHRSVVVAAGGPAEKVDPAVVGRRKLHIVLPHKIVLPVGETPGIRRGPVPEVALREEHLPAGTDGKEPPGSPFRNRTGAFSRRKGDFVAISGAGSGNDIGPREISCSGRKGVKDDADGLSGQAGPERFRVPAVNRRIVARTPAYPLTDTSGIRDIHQLQASCCTRFRNV